MQLTPGSRSFNPYSTETDWSQSQYSLFFQLGEFACEEVLTDKNHESAATSDDLFLSSANIAMA